MQFTEGQVDVNGINVRYWEAGQGRPVVMLDQTGWRNTALHDALAQKYQIFSLELPGTGESEPNKAAQSLVDLASVASAAASALTSDRYTLIGTSSWADVALWQTLQSPDQVEALILVSPTAIGKMSAGGKPTADEHHASMFAHAENAQKFTPLSPEIFAKEEELIQRLDSETREAEAKFADIHCPTLAIFGKNDRLVSPEAARVYREKILNCNIAVVYDAGHCIVGDRPEALVNAVVDYAEHWETFIVGHQTGLINP